MNNKDLEEKEKMKRRSQWEAFDQMVDDFASKNAFTSSEKKEGGGRRGRVRKKKEEESLNRTNLRRVKAQRGT